MIPALLLLLFAAGFARYGAGFALGVGLGLIVGAAFWMRVGMIRRGVAHSRGILRSHLDAIGGRR